MWLSWQVTGILSWIVRAWTDVENNIVSVERVKEYAQTAKEVRGFELGRHRRVSLHYLHPLYYMMYYIKSYIMYVLVRDGRLESSVQPVLRSHEIYNILT